MLRPSHTFGTICAKCGGSIRYKVNGACVQCHNKKPPNPQRLIWNEAREQARAQGFPTFTGSPCTKCGSQLRLTAAGSCKACALGRVKGIKVIRDEIFAYKGCFAVWRIGEVDNADHQRAYDLISLLSGRSGSDEHLVFATTPPPYLMYNRAAMLAWPKHKPIFERGRSLSDWSNTVWHMINDGQPDPRTEEEMKLHSIITPYILNAYLNHFREKQGGAILSLFEKVR